MEGTVSSDETSVLACYTRNIQTDQKTPKTLSDILAPGAEIKTKDKNLLHKKPSRKRKGNQQKRQMYTQVLSKNELVINAEEEKGEEGEKENKQKTK